MKTNEEINRYFTEEVFGKCWHEPSGKTKQRYNERGYLINVWDSLCNCGKIYERNKGCGNINPDYFSKEGFWDIHDFVYSDKFYSNGFIRYAKGIPASKVFHYSQLARDVYNFLEGK